MALQRASLEPDIYRNSPSTDTPLYSTAQTMAPIKDMAWERWKNAIHTLYMVEKRRLEGKDGVIETMKSRHHFVARLATPPALTPHLVYLSPQPVPRTDASQQSAV